MHPRPKSARIESAERLDAKTAPRLLIEGLSKDDRDSLAAAFDAQGALAYGLALRIWTAQPTPKK